MALKWVHYWVYIRIGWYDAVCILIIALKDEYLIYIYINIYAYIALFPPVDLLIMLLIKCNFRGQTFLDFNRHDEHQHAQIHA